MSATGEGMAADPRAYWSALSTDTIAEMLDRLSDGLVVLGPDWRYRYVNERAAEILGRTVEDLVGKCIWEEFPESTDPFRSTFERVADTREPISSVSRYEPWDRWFEMRVVPQDECLVIHFRDVTAQQELEEELRENGQRMAEAERIVRFGVWHWEIATGRVRWSDQLHRIYGMEPGEFGGTVEDFTAQLHPDDRERVWNEVSRSLETQQPFVFEERIIRQDGEQRTLLSQGHPVVAADGTLKALVGVCHDITDRAAIEQALGNSERRLRAIVDNTPSIITVKDLAGRYVMANAEAARVFGVDSEDLVGRTCADFFPPEISVPQTANERLAAAESDPVYDEMVLIRDGAPRNFLSVTFSLPDEKGRPAEICTIATDVTEEREREGERLERTTWTKRIDRALEENRFMAFAQPIVDLGTDEVVSHELLARMLTAGDRPQILDPGSFLPPAERYGLIQKIDCWMVRQALEMEGDGFAHVNLSAVTMCDDAARAEIIGLLEALPDRAKRVVFEITETAVPEHFEASCGFGERVAALGCRLALDDFGTGFGALTYLNSMPLSFIKIDLSFVRGLASKPENRRMVESIIGIADVFGLQSVAEGAEDEATLKLLRELGADYAQGFHLGRPAPLSPRPMDASLREAVPAASAPA